MGGGFTRRNVGGAKRTGTKQAAEMTYVAALRQSTSCELSVAMPRPLSAGPMTIPRLVVTWSRAFAAVYCCLETSDGIDAVSAGPKTAVATACNVTKTYNDDTVKASTGIQQGINPITSARTRSELINSAFLCRRATAEPMSGASTIAGTGCRRPMMLVFRGEPVTE